MDSLVLNVVIGLVFVFGVIAFVASTVTEAVSRFFGLRAEYLLRGIRSMVDGPGEFQLPDLREARAFFGGTPSPPPNQVPDANITKVLGNPVVVTAASDASMPADAGNTRLSRRDRRKVPSYLSSRAFARAVLDIAVPDAEGETTFTQVEAGVAAMEAGPLKDSLSTLVRHAGGSLKLLRQTIEEWYDDQMARVSGWYKRHIRWITLGVAALLVLAFNLNGVRIADALYSDQALRETVIAQAFQNSRCGSEDPAACLREVRDEIADARDLGLPVGWTVTPACVGNDSCSWLDRRGVTAPEDGALGDLRALLILLVGYLLIVLAVVPGARFWFDLLGRFGSLRESGPKPPSSA